MKAGFFRVTLLGLSCLMASAVHGQVSEADRGILVDFYLATGGDDWHRNDGWLDDAVDVCGWYGIQCHFDHDAGRDVIYILDLAENNLAGEMDSRVFEIVHWTLDLSDNRIEGVLEKLPRSPGRVDLSNNRLSGPLPDGFAPRADIISGASLPSSTWYLDLSGNQLDGEVPAEWPGATWLSLANNRLEGMPLSLFEQDLNAHYGRFLDLSDNRFSGTLPTAIMGRNFMPHDGQSRWGGGLNLCWNDFVIDDAGLAEWIGEHHVGGANFEQCLSRERLAAGPELSGSWFDPDRAGEGVAMQLLEGGGALLYWFTFDDEGGQRWLFEAGDALDHALEWKPLMQTRGHFNQGLDLDGEEPPLEVRGSFRLDRTGEDAMMAERVYIDSLQNICLAIYPPPLNCFGSSLSDRLDYQRLTELAGTTCDSQSDFQQFSGAWYNPERSGEGFIVEILPDDQAVIYWFTYTADGSGEQAWMIAIGEMESQGDNNIIITPPPTEIEARMLDIPIYQPLGGVYGPDFDPELVEMTDWGTLSIGFFDADSGHVAWDSHLDEFGSGDYPIERLARPMLAECD